MKIIKYVEEKATDLKLIDANWDAILECVDLIRSKEIKANIAVESIRKRLHNDSGGVVHRTLVVLEACMKNCGPQFHVAVANKEFLDEFKNLALEPNPQNVRAKVLELLNCWAHAFCNKPELKIIVDTHNLMSLAGFEFPKVEITNILSLECGTSDWSDDTACLRCRINFGILTRKHHCRACGQVFCDKCSRKQPLLFQYGIEKQVRMCIKCIENDSLSKRQEAAFINSKLLFDNPSVCYGQSPKVARTPAKSPHRQLVDDDEDFNLAIALSESQAEEEKRRKNITVLTNDKQYTEIITNESELTHRSDSPTLRSDLARYLSKDYWKHRYESNKQHFAWSPSRQQSQRQQLPFDKRSANARRSSSVVMPSAPLPSIISHPVDDTVDGSRTSLESDQGQLGNTLKFCHQLREQVITMDNRIRSNVARGRPVVNDTSIQSLFIQLTEMHAQVVARINKLENHRNFLESLQDEIAHIQEARQALDALRVEYQEREEQRIHEQRRLLQIQMQAKVNEMRNRKHEMIWHQRQLALMRFQNDEQQLMAQRVENVKLFSQDNASKLNSTPEWEQYQTNESAGGGYAPLIDPQLTLVETLFPAYKTANAEISIGQTIQELQHSTDLPFSTGADEEELIKL